MLRNTVFSAAFRRVATTVAVVAAVAAAAAPVALQAQARHRARLSRDLAERLQQRIEASSEVIVSASDGSIDQLVARYGARLKKRIHGGAVLEATGGQIDAISQDDEVDHIASNARVYRMMAVTTEATGADQVWDGSELGLARGFTGRGIGVAVIDSGVAAHSALKGRIVASMDFTDGATAKTWGSTSTATGRTSPARSPGGPRRLPRDGAGRVDREPARRSRRTARARPAT